jgi:hypothetical protein
VPAHARAFGGDEVQAVALSLIAAQVGRGLVSGCLVDCAAGRFKVLRAVR